LADKLSYAFISLLTGAHRLVEINIRRADQGLQRAFGYQGSASFLNQSSCVESLAFPWHAQQFTRASVLLAPALCRELGWDRRNENAL
jgi:hypothetical protein